MTGSEKEALLLEINLIKDYTPEYNIMFMDNTYYPYIELTDETHPRLKIVRKTKNKKNKYFGPYPDATAARNTFKLLNKLYPLRKCNHVPDKPCLYYSLHQCLGPCINEVDKSQYDEIRKELISFIHGNTKSKIDELTEKMMTASENLQFELAKEYRDLIRSIEYVTAKQNVQFGDYKDRDILGYFIDKGYISIQLFFMREGKLLYHDFNLEPVGEDFEEDLIRFLVTYYQTHPEPYELLIPQDVDLELLTEILSCHVLQPQRGDKKSLVEMANKNAKEALEKKFLLKEKTDEKTILPIIYLNMSLKDFKNEILTEIQSTAYILTSEDENFHQAFQKHFHLRNNSYILYLNHEFQKISFLKKESPQEFIEKVKIKIQSYVLQRTYSFPYNMKDFQHHIIKKIIENHKENDFLENSSIEQQVLALEDKKKNLQKNIDDLNNQILILENQNKELGSYIKQQGYYPLILKGNEKEFYKGEQRDLLLYLLKEVWHRQLRYCL